MVPTTIERSPGSGVVRRLGLAVLPVAFVLLWSSGYLVGSIGSRASGAPLALVSWRFLIALCVLAGIAVLTRAPWPRAPRVWLHLLLIGALLQTAQIGGAYLALANGVPAGLSSLVLSAAPLGIAAAGGPMFGEWLSRRQWLGLLLGLAGIACSLSGQLSRGSRQELVGYACSGLALAGLTVGTLYQKRAGLQVDLRTGTSIQLLGAVLTSFPLALAHGGLGLPLNGRVIFALVWLALVSSIGCFILLFVLLRRRSGGAATSLLYLVPPVTALIGIPLLGEPVAAGVVIGMAISGAGVLLVLFAGGGRCPAAPAVRTGREAALSGAGPARL